MRGERLGGCVRACVCAWGAPRAAPRCPAAVSAAGAARGFVRSAVCARGARPGAVPRGAGGAARGTKAACGVCAWGGEQGVWARRSGCNPPLHPPPRVAEHGPASAAGLRAGRGAGLAVPGGGWRQVGVPGGAGPPRAGEGSGEGRGGPRSAGGCRGAASRSHCLLW